MARIAVVDDHEDTCAVLRILLTCAGHSVETFTTGIEFLKWFRRGAADLVLLDIVLPECDGYDVLKMLRLRDPDVPVVALTAWVFPGDTERIIGQGFSLHIRKPILDFDTFLRGVSRYAETGGTEPHAATGRDITRRIPF